MYGSWKALLFVSVADSDLSVVPPLPEKVRPSIVPRTSPALAPPILLVESTTVMMPFCWSIEPLSAAPYMFGFAVLTGTDSTVVTVPYSNEGTPEASVFIPQ